MPTDTELILSAIRETPSRKDQKKRVMQEFDDFGLQDVDIDRKDALYKLSKRIRRRENKEKRKSRPLDEWTHTDFLVFAQDLLKTYSIHLENNGSFGADMMARLYDRLASVLQHDMNNKVLKDYLQWWVLCFAPSLTTPSIWMQTIYDEKYVIRFLKRYNAPDVKKVKNVETRITEDDDTLYKAGGLSMLLMKRGIVTTYAFLQGRKETNIFTKITKALRSFSEKVLKSTIDITINSAPYPASQKVDFISLARPSLEMHGLKRYLAFDYATFFKEPGK